MNAKVVLRHRFSRVNLKGETFDFTINGVMPLVLVEIRKTYFMPTLSLTMLVFHILFCFVMAQLNER